MASKLLPFRDYDEHEVINLFKYSGTIPADQGTIVSINNGWNQSQETQLLGAVGKSYQNTVSDRYGVSASVTAAGTGDTAILLECFFTMLKKKTKTVRSLSTILASLRRWRQYSVVKQFRLFHEESSCTAEARLIAKLLHQDRRLYVVTPTDLLTTGQGGT